MEGHRIWRAQKNTDPEQNFRGQAMLNHSYLRSIIDKEVSKKAMVTSVIKKGFPSKSLANNPPPPSALFTFAKLHYCS